MEAVSNVKAPAPWCPSGFPLGYGLWGCGSRVLGSLLTCCPGLRSTANYRNLAGSPEEIKTCPFNHAQKPMLMQCVAESRDVRNSE